MNWKYIGFDYVPGEISLICMDINNDSNEEIVTDCNRGQFFVVLKYIDGNYRQIWASEHFEDKITDIKLFDKNNDLIFEIYVLHQSGKLNIYNAQSFELESSIELNINPAKTLDVIDVDNDSTIEFVVSKLSYDNGNVVSLYVFNSDNLETEWDTTNISVNRFDIEIGDVDNDKNNEIVISSGLVLDGVDHSVDWYFSNGFGWKIYIADLDEDKINEIVGIDNWVYIRAFDAFNMMQLWEITSNESLQSISVNENSPNGTEIIVGNDQWGSISCYSGSDQSLLWDINNPLNGSTNIVVGDPDNDGEREVIWAAGEGSSGPDHIYVANIDTEVIEWKSDNYHGPYFIDLFDTDHDGTEEIIGGISSSVVFTLNSYTHQIEHIRDEFENFIELNTLAVGNLDGSEGGEILISSRNLIYALNGETFDIYWNGTIGSFGEEITDMVIGDVDNDSTSEIVLGTDENYIYLFNGETFEQEWRSIKTISRIEKILLENCDEDDAVEILFLRYDGGIEIYDGLTHYLEWQSTTLVGIINFDVADFDRNGVKDIIACKSNGEIFVIDCETKAITHSFNLGTTSLSGILVENTDADSSNEIIIGSTKLQIFNADDLTLEYESQPLGENVGFKNNMLVTDVDNDQQIDIFASNKYGLYHFEGTESTVDVSQLEFVIDFQLSQNFPNPFNPDTKINYKIPNTNFIIIRVYDVLGHEIANLVNEEKPAGNYEVVFDASDLASGVYFYRLQAGNFLETKKMLLLK